MITMRATAPGRTVPGRTVPVRRPRGRPARRVWLAIGVPVCLVLIGWIGLNLVALAGQGQFPVGRGIPARAGRVNVNISSGAIRLQEVAGDQAKLAGTAHYSLVRPRFTTRVTPTATDFGYDCNFPVGNCYLNATVSVPRGTPASVHTGGGDATVIGTTGDVTLTSAGGNVSAERASGDLTLNTDGGDVSATAITATRVTASTSGGDITVVFTSVPTDVKVTTDGGNVTIVVPRGSTHYNLTEHTDGGTTSSQVPTDSSSTHVLTATSRGGDISVRQS
jgi:hypothetical protein